MEPGTITVDCPNRHRGGRPGLITLRLKEQAGEMPSGKEFTMFTADLLKQTCECEYSEDEWEALMDRAHLEIERRDES